MTLCEGSSLLIRRERPVSLSRAAGDVSMRVPYRRTAGCKLRPFAISAESLIRVSRSTGSSTSVCRSTVNSASWLADSHSAICRIDRGTIAANPLPDFSPFSDRYASRAPATTVRKMSLTVTSGTAARIALMSAPSSVRKSIVMSPPSTPLNRVGRRSAEYVGSSPASSASRTVSAATFVTDRPRPKRIAWPGKPTTVRPIKSSDESPEPARFVSGFGGPENRRLVRSRIARPSPAPWWVLSMISVRLPGSSSIPCTPVMTCNSQGGRDKSIGSPSERPSNSRTGAHPATGARWTCT